jgi:chromosome partitioning protein
MKIIALLQQKGGVGKTTLSVHLTVAIKALRPDLSIAIADADPQESSSAWLKLGVAGVPTHRVAQDNEGKNLLADLKDISADIIVLDLPPALATISLRAALHSQLLLIPSGPSTVDLRATRAAVELAHEAMSMVPGKQMLLIPNKVRWNTSSGRQLRDALAAWGPVAKTTVCQREAFAEAALVGLGATQHAPESPAAEEITALAKEVLLLLGLN